MAPKSWLSSSTIVGLLGIAGVQLFEVLTNPEFFGKAATCADAFGRRDVADTLRTFGGPIAVLALSGFSAVGRFKASSPLYTPKWLPGPNKEELQNREKDNFFQDERLKHHTDLLSQVLEAVKSSPSRQTDFDQADYDTVHVDLDEERFLA